MAVGERRIVSVGYGHSHFLEEAAPGERVLSQAGYGRHTFTVETVDRIDDFVLSLLPPQEAASLTQEQLDVLRAHIRSEILFSEAIRKILTDRATEVLGELRAGK
jgi:hypothetical protein